jgi:hypothetical protein
MFRVSLPYGEIILSTSLIQLPYWENYKFVPNTGVPCKTGPTHWLIYIFEENET